MIFSKRTLLWVLLGVVAIYGIVCADVVFRARHAYLEGEKAATPQLAYAWYEAAATLFVPPESKWSRLAREKLPAAKEKWIADMHTKKIPIQDVMFE